MTSPRRIAVVILATGIGFAVQHFAGLANATIAGALLGLVFAPMIPRRGASAQRVHAPRTADRSEADA